MPTPDNILQMAAEITKATVSASTTFGITNELYQDAVVNVLDKVTKKLLELSEMD